MLGATNINNKIGSNLLSSTWLHYDYAQYVLLILKICCVFNILYCKYCLSVHQPNSYIVDKFA